MAALLPATKPLASICIDILGLLQRTKKGYRFLLVITDRFDKLTQVITFRKITTYTVAVPFVEHWVFKYGLLECLISDNGNLPLSEIKITRLGRTWTRIV